MKKASSECVTAQQLPTENLHSNAFFPREGRSLRLLLIHELLTIT